ncbi:MAG TPA: sulfurtransferase complex subunit TusB [Methanomassiliicoccales archaeon]|nr:sulfurtransferase complex subunit TusB [Methanomassiliicoccales archaeon]
MRSKLFITMKSPHEFGGLDLMRSSAKGAKSALVLFEDAVIFAANAKMGKELLTAVQDVYVMRDDWEARGLPLAVPEFKIVDYPEVIDLIMERYEQTITV